MAGRIIVQCAEDLVAEFFIERLRLVAESVEVSSAAAAANRLLFHRLYEPRAQPLPARRLVDPDDRQVQPSSAGFAERCADKRSCIVARDQGEVGILLQ